MELRGLRLLHGPGVVPCSDDGVDEWRAGVVRPEREPGAGEHERRQGAGKCEMGRFVKTRAGRGRDGRLGLELGKLDRRIDERLDRRGLRGGGGLGPAARDRPADDEGSDE